MSDKTPTPELVVAKKKDLDLVIQLIREYHKLEGLEVRSSELSNAVYPLLRKQNDQGYILLITLNAEVIGYIALCFGYSIEFGGRDAFIDELFLKADFRGKKIGKAVLQSCKYIAHELGANALHLEVNREKGKLKKMYEHCGFSAYEKNVRMSAELK